MGWLKKKSDPVSDRAQALNSEIAALEAQIKKLDDQLQREPEQPRLRSTAVPHGMTSNRSAIDPAAGAPLTARTEPVFEHINQERITTRNEMPNTPEHFNEYGVRKYDFPALVQRLRTFFTGPSTSNPKLVNYLAAGGVHGLRPLRKEKRVARNRFIFFFIILFVILFGTLWKLLRGT
jgi:cell division protein FtsB